MMSNKKLSIISVVAVIPIVIFGVIFETTDFVREDDIAFQKMFTTVSPEVTFAEHVDKNPNVNYGSFASDVLRISPLLQVNKSIFDSDSLIVNVFGENHLVHKTKITNTYEIYGEESGGIHDDGSFIWFGIVGDKPSSYVSFSIDENDEINLGRISMNSNLFSFHSVDDFVVVVDVDRSKFPGPPVDCPLC